MRICVVFHEPEKKLFNNNVTAVKGFFKTSSTEIILFVAIDNRVHLNMYNLPVAF